MLELDAGVDMLELGKLELGVLEVGFAQVGYCWSWILLELDSAGVGYC